LMPVTGEGGQRRDETAEPSLRLPAHRSTDALFGVEIDQDVVRGLLAKHCRPSGGSDDHGSAATSIRDLRHPRRERDPRALDVQCRSLAQRTDAIVVHAVRS
jgi:hypothetical protein